LFGGFTSVVIGLNSAGGPLSAIAAALNGGKVSENAFIIGTFGGVAFTYL
jgi:hypothetical protein